MSSEKVAQVEHLNSQADSAVIDRAMLDAILAKQGQAFTNALKPEHKHLFSDAVVFVTPLQVAQMQAVIAAVEEVAGPAEERSTRGVFYGYDFHLNEQGAHLIEINTNAGGAFLNALLIESQREVLKSGSAVGEQALEQVFIRMFRDEWRRVHADTELTTIAMVDEQPELQYLYPEFLLAQKMFEAMGIVAYIADPSALQTREDGLYCNGQRVDLIYNRLTDFELKQTRPYPLGMGETAGGADAGSAALPALRGQTHTGATFEQRMVAC